MYEDAEGYGVEVDNWALGVILYTLLDFLSVLFHRIDLLNREADERGTV